MPIFGLAVVIAVVLGVIGELSCRQQAEDLVHQRGDAVLEGVAEQVEERQRAKEVFAQLLAGNDDLISAVEKGDKIGISQVLVPLKTDLNLGFVFRVYDGEGQELSRLGGIETAGSPVPWSSPPSPA